MIERDIIKNFLSNFLSVKKHHFFKEKSAKNRVLKSNLQAVSVKSFQVSFVKIEDNFERLTITKA